jgi:fluoride exporter
VALRHPAMGLAGTADTADGSYGGKELSVTVVLIAVGATAGAVARYAIELVLPAGPNGTHYAGTLVVNLSGAFALGLVMGALGHRFAEDQQLRVLVTVGFLSSYTTLSALAYQVVHLGERGDGGVAFAYGLGTLAGGVALAYGGLVFGRALA